MITPEIKTLICMSDSEFAELIHIVSTDRKFYTQRSLYDAILFRSLWGEPIKFDLRQTIFSALHTLEPKGFTGSMPLLLNTILKNHLQCEIGDVDVENTIPDDSYLASRLALSQQSPANCKEMSESLMASFVSNMYGLKFGDALQCMSALILWDHSEEIEKQITTAFTHISTYRQCFNLDVPEKEIAIYEHCFAQSKRKI